MPIGLLGNYITRHPVEKAKSKNPTVTRHERWDALETSFLVKPGAPDLFADELTIDSSQRACLNSKALGATRPEAETTYTLLNLNNNFS